MKSKLSISELKEDVKKYHSFFLESDDPLKPLRAMAQFNQIAVNISGRPYIALKNDFGEATIRHIQTIRKESEGPICTYIFTCLDYSSESSPSKVDLHVDCFQ